MHGTLPIARELLIVSLWLYKPCGSVRNFGTEMIDFKRTKKLVLKKKEKKKTLFFLPCSYRQEVVSKNS